MLTESNNFCLHNGTMYTMNVINVMQIISDVTFIPYINLTNRSAFLGTLFTKLIVDVAGKN
jgi:hypothetical protein